jgi:cytosine/uracil/thiamine/allantoin permease
MGATYAVPFPVIIRSTFGMYGSFPAICIRGMLLQYVARYTLTDCLSAFVALMWTAILTVQAGNFLQRCIEAIWPSFINFPNNLSEGAGVDCKSS